MAYSWEKESLQKYGEEVTSRLIKRQKEYEEENKNNNCKYCGKENEGVIIEWEDGKPFVMHYGLWIEYYCKFCNRHQND